jgi:type II secretory pathway pseudopilin PulG
MYLAIVGYSLLEIMLVLLVFASITLYGTIAYNSMSKLVAAHSLSSNVDLLLRRLAGYYRANCQTSSFATVSGGTASIVPVSLTDLLDSGYNLPSNVLVNTTNSFVAQFNPIISNTPITVNACVIVTPGQKCSAAGGTITTSTAQVLSWIPQVAVNIADSHIATDLLLTGADCISSATTVAGVTTVNPCSVICTNACTYLVWSRIPAAANLGDPSMFSASLPLVKQFNMQYTQDSYYQYNNSNTYSPSSMTNVVYGSNPVGGQSAPVYYTCNG